MGLQNQLSDASSESIPLLLVALIANCVAYLRSFFFSVFHSVGLRRLYQAHVMDDGLFRSVGSGLAGLIVLAEQRKLNRVSSYKYCCGGGDSNINDKGGSDCVVCLCTLRHGDQVRKLDCRHVFHKECIDGWLDHLNFNCPLCRSSLVSDERVEETRRRVGDDLADWFSLR
ncbi:E3 UBIQUITIN-PROTEIN LIGASE RHA2A [Salix purpurea]|uniref:E3 UBIQUITIN-PROTEIN LIGASE RHA2A n=1 Tax=Salix purpurea TaxID=77065 RepID=A0A9Q0TW45_SALPP|nr:E3 UBIQUITIN-PROTEIN LIGASE RHA2A [Salix purpurea]